jgi:tripartite-type tricarboxylate transporter receptor subunit TctC
MFTNRRLLKGIIIVALLGILSFALGGCGGKEEPKKEEIKYPTKPISAICPWSAGGSSDVAFRGYLNYLKKELGQEINVTNITGGNGSIGWSAAAKADPFAVTTLLYFSSISMLVRKDSSFKDIKAMIPVLIQSAILVGIVYSVFRVFLKVNLPHGLLF